MDIKQKVKAFLSKYIQTASINDDENFFERKLVNSLFAMQLVMFLEKDFDLTIDNEELDIENFQSVNAIVSFVEQKLS